MARLRAKRRSQHLPRPAPPFSSSSLQSEPLRFQVRLLDSAVASVYSVLTPRAGLHTEGAVDYPITVEGSGLPAPSYQWEQLVTNDVNVTTNVTLVERSYDGGEDVRILLFQGCLLACSDASPPSRCAHRSF
jgi:hypothetical protein